MLSEADAPYKRFGLKLSRAFNLSVVVARNLSGCHKARGGRNEADSTVTGDTEVRFVEAYDGVEYGTLDARSAARLLKEKR